MPKSDHSYISPRHGTSKHVNSLTHSFSRKFDNANTEIKY